MTRLELSRHAMQRAIARNILPEAVQAVLDRPRYAWPSWSHKQYNGDQGGTSIGRATMVYQRGALRVVVGDDGERLVSTIWDWDVTGRNPDIDTTRRHNADVLKEDPLPDWTQPTVVDDVDLAFPARGISLTPALDEIPDDFAPAGWGDLVGHIFAFGSDDSLKLIPAPGIDPKVAWRHIRVVLGCYGLKHEHKTRGAAWLLSLWFTAAIWDCHHGECEAGDPETARLLREAWA